MGNVGIQSKPVTKVDLGKTETVTYQGRFALSSDGTPIVKTESARSVAILPDGPAMKTALAGLGLGDVIKVTGTKTKIVKTTIDAFSGPAIEACKIEVISKATPLSIISGSVMEIIPFAPGYPQGIFLKLDQPVVVGGESHDQIQLPGSYGSQMGRRFTLQGELVNDASSNGTKFARFASSAGITVMEQPVIQGEPVSDGFDYSLLDGA